VNIRLVKNKKMPARMFLRARLKKLNKKKMKALTTPENKKIYQSPPLKNLKSVFKRSTNSENIIVAHK
jgi:hypothetical protein